MLRARPLRVLQVVSSMSLGGAERVVASLTAGLRRRGLEVHVASLASLSGDPLRRAFEADGFAVRDLGARHFYDVLALRRLLAFMRECRPDLVHTHLVYADAMGRAAGALLRRPVVSTIHTAPQGIAALRRDHAFVERFGARRLTARLVAVSEQGRRAFTTTWGLPADRVVEIPNGIDLARWLAVPAAAALTGRAARPPTLLSVGRLHPIKAHDVLLRAMKVVVAQQPAARLIIIGEGDDLAALQALARALGIEAHVEFAGVRHDVPAYMARADVFVLPSLWEGLSLAIIEAMAAARPVIVTDVGGNGQVLGRASEGAAGGPANLAPPSGLAPGGGARGATGAATGVAPGVAPGAASRVAVGAAGLLVPPSDPDALAEAILTLLRDPALRDAMARRGRARAEREFGVDRMAERYAALYEEVVLTARRSRRTARSVAPSGTEERRA